MELVLNFIMKNEQSVLPRMLASVKNFVDGIYCLDTGSDDASVQIVKDFIKENNLHGEVRINTECIEEIGGEKHFIYDRARNAALEMIKDRNGFMYWQDCDEQLSLPKDLDIKKFKEILSKYDKATAMVVKDGHEYARSCFFRIKKDFKWVGSIHEVIAHDPAEFRALNCPYIKIIVTSDGATWKAGEIEKKYAKHAKVLEWDFKKNNDPRSLFYWSQSEKDTGNSEKAIELYRQRAHMDGGFYEERFYSQFYVALLTESMGKPIENIIFEYLKAYEMDTARGESMLNLIVALQNHNMWQTAYVFGKMAVEQYHKKNPYPHRMLFIHTGCYDHLILDAHVRTCEQLGKKAEINVLKPKNTIEELFDSIPSGWTGHREFTSWLMNYVKPEVTVDLGVDHGYSLFSFATANVGKVYGIDHFEGDSFTGIRNTYDEVSDNIQWLKDKHRIFNTEIIKGKFDEVAQTWNKKIDILHIDGMPIYDELKNDFSKWSSFLSDNGVVLIHNTQQYDDVKKFFSELQGHKYEFDHSGGLGILCKTEETIKVIKDKYSPKIIMGNDVVVKPQISFGYILHDLEVFNDYYLPSLEALYNENQDKYTIELLQTESKDANPAHNYNEMIKKATSDYIVLTHTDVTFSPDFIDRIFETIKEVPDFGALGIVGVDSNRNYHWASEDKIKKVETLDCCCIIVNKKHGILFDEDNFGEFHLYVEDRCMSANSKGLSCYTIRTNAKEMDPKINYNALDKSGSFFNHHSATVASRGFAWGRYHEFKQVLNKKWGREVKTT